MIDTPEQVEGSDGDEQPKGLRPGQIYALNKLSDYQAPALPGPSSISDTSRLTDVMCEDVLGLNAYLHAIEIAIAITHPAFEDRLIKLVKAATDIRLARRKLLLMPAEASRNEKQSGFYEPIDDD